MKNSNITNFPRKLLHDLKILCMKMELFEKKNNMENMALLCDPISFFIEFLNETLQTSQSFQRKIYKWNFVTTNVLEDPKINCYSRKCKLFMKKSK